MRKTPKLKPRIAPKKPIRDTYVIAGGLPKMVFLTGIPEMTFISSSLKPNCCNVSMPFEAGSKSSNTARSVVVSAITSLSLLQVTERGNFGLADLANQVSLLSLLDFPNRNQRNKSRSQHIQKQEQCECTDRHRDFNARIILTPGERHSIDS